MVFIKVAALISYSHAKKKGNLQALVDRYLYC